MHGYQPNESESGRSPVYVPFVCRRSCTADHQGYGEGEEGGAGKGCIGFQVGHSSIPSRSPLG